MVKLINLDGVTQEDITEIIKNSDVDYREATESWIDRSLESIEADMKMVNATYDCGEEGEEISELSMKFTFKKGSLFQPHSSTKEEFALKAFKSLVEGEISCFVGIHIENPDG